MIWKAMIIVPLMMGVATSLSQPAAEHSGTCPDFSKLSKPDVMNCLYQTRVCSGDSYCSNEEKCCPDACGYRVCTSTNKIRTGSCPAVRYPLTCPQPGGTIASSCNNDDRLCPTNQKCCHNGCGLECLNPVKIVKQGQCPTVSESKENNCRKQDMVKYPCSSDEHCPVDQKCCSTGCGMTCTAPIIVKPGFCPEPSPGTGGACVELCSRDADCHGQEKCCSNGCGHSCQNPASIEKDGKCPKYPSYQGDKCPKSCVGDWICPDNQKCCYSEDCGYKICHLPKGVRPGKCPSSVKDPKKMCKKHCKKDCQCKKNWKCCEIDGRQVCAEPIGLH